MESRDTRNRTEASPTPWAYTTTIRYPEKILVVSGCRESNSGLANPNREYYRCTTSRKLHRNNSGCGIADHVGRYFSIPIASEAVHSLQPHAYGVSGCWESNPSLMLPKQVYYHYTTARYLKRAWPAGIY